MWWLILCVTLTGYRVPRWKILNVSVRVFLVDICLWINKTQIGRWSSPVWVGMIQSTGGPARTKGGGRRNWPLFIPCLLAWAETSHLIFSSPPTGIYTIVSGCQASRLWLELYHSFSCISSLKIADCGTSQPPSYMSQFLIINLHIFLFFFLLFIYLPIYLSVY